MKREKFYWVGQRMLDGVIYAQVLRMLDTIFCCDTCDLTEEWEKRLTIFSLERQLHQKLDWSSFSISSIFKQFADEISACDAKGYRMFPYALPCYTSHLKKSNSIVNWRTVSFYMPRAVQRMILSKAGIAVPPWLAIDDNMKWKHISGSLGTETVIQYDNTSSGHGTFLVRNKEQYELVKKHKGSCPSIAGVFIPSIPISCHILVENNEVVTSVPSVQIIEDETRCSITSLRYCGNDFSIYNLLSDVQKRRCKNVQESVGMFLANIGVRGLLGVDMLVTKDEVFVNEVNFRLQNSTPLYTMIEMNAGVKPLVHHLIYSTHPDECYHLDRGTIQGAQYILRSHAGDISHITSGMYNQNGKLLKEGVALFSTISKGEYLIISECGGLTTEISEGAEIAKIYALDPMLGIDGRTTKRFLDFLEKFPWT